MTFSVPVLYYHRIGAPDPIHLSIPTAEFEAQMNFLSRRGFETITMARLIAHISGKTKIARRSVAITFDDGFRDNYGNAFPILKKLGLKAAIFPATALIRPDDHPGRDVSGAFNEAHTRARRGDLGDFLSFSEITKMVSSGVCEFHSHSHSHNQVFVGNEIRGIYPDTDNHWGILSAYGDCLENADWPIFARGPGLINKAWCPNLQAIKKEFSRGNTDRVKMSMSCFSIEDDERFITRIRKELTISRDLLKPFHSEGCDVICWPWGASDSCLVAEAKRAGYHGALKTCTGSNSPGSDPYAVFRFPIKKKGLFRFALGIFLRSNPALAKIYGSFWGRI